MKYVTKNGRFALEQMLLLNISAVLGKGTIEVAGVDSNAGDIKAPIQERTDATKLVESLRAQYLQAVKDERETLARTEEQLADIRAALVGRYKAKPEILAQLGLAPPKKRRKLTGKEIVAKAAKAEVTRNGGHSPTLDATPPNPITPPASPVVVNGASGSH